MRGGERRARVEGEGSDVGGDGDHRHESREVEAAYETADRGAEAPEPRIPATAVEADRRVHTVELAARIAEART